MVSRRALVVGSECADLPDLPFVADRVAKLAAVLEDETLGRWKVTRAVDPKRAKLERLIKRELQAANNAGTVALIALLGHGKTFGDDYYFMPKNGSGKGESDQDLLLTQVLHEQLRSCVSLEGLILLVDTCESGIVATRADDWLQEPNFPYHIMTSALHDVVRDGAFTHELTTVIRTGLAASPEFLRTDHVYSALLGIPAVANRQPQQKTHGDLRQLWLTRNAAFDQAGHVPRNDPGLKTGLVATRRPLDGYRLPTDMADPVSALHFSERDRLQLGVVWGLDRTQFHGIVVDLPDSDISSDLNAVENVVADAAAIAALRLPRRQWVLLPVRPRPDGGDWDGLVPTNLVDPVAFVLSIDLDGIPVLSSQEWEAALAGVLRDIRAAHPRTALVTQLRTASVANGARTARRITGVVRMIESLEAEVVTRFVPGADEDRCTHAPPRQPGAADRVERFVSALAAAQGWDPVPTPPDVHPAELVAGVVRRLGADDAADRALLERVRAYASPLWRPVVRRDAHLEVSHPAVLEIAARLDEDLGTWLDVREEVGGLRPADLPEVGHDVPDALARILRWRAAELPHWLVRRMSRSAREVVPTSPDLQLLDVLRRRPVTPAWAAEVVRNEVLRQAVRLIPSSDPVDAQLLRHLQEVNAAARPALPPPLPTIPDSL